MCRVAAALPMRCASGCCTRLAPRLASTPVRWLCSFGATRLLFVVRLLFKLTTIANATVKSCWMRKKCGPRAAAQRRRRRSSTRCPAPRASSSPRRLPTLPPTPRPMLRTLSSSSLFVLFVVVCESNCIVVVHHCLKKLLALYVARFLVVLCFF
jgi:hypothetical protein